MGQRNLFNKITKRAKHVKYNSSLQKFNDVIDWKIFHEDLDPMYINIDREKVVDLLMTL